MNLRGAYLKGRSYAGLQVPAVFTGEAYAQLQELLGSEDFRAVVEARQARDALHQHLTVLRPREVRQLRKAGALPADIPNFPVEAVGVGTVSAGDRQAWFLVCRSEAVQLWRASLGLEPHDLHVTLGFRGGDIHHLSKDDTTLLRQIGCE